VLQDVKAADATLDFSDFRGARIIGAKLLRASLVGVDVTGAIFDKSDLRESDLYWTELTPENLPNCRTKDARWPEKAPAVYGPKDAVPPQVQVRPLHVSALGENERRARAQQRTKEPPPYG
jgi:hypothetical protein